MSIKSFKFVSPGVFINEIDNSFIPASSEEIGPVVIGRSQRGLAMQPVKVGSYSDFVEMFGDTVPGGGAGNDVYRDGNLQSPMYGTYAAKAFLNANVAPLTYIRLLGQQSNNATEAGYAGWQTTSNINATAASNGGAYGLWVWPSSSGNPAADGGVDLGTGQLAAIWYLDTAATIALSGALLGGFISSSYPNRDGSDTMQTDGNTAGIGKVIGTDASNYFTVTISSSYGGEEKTKFGFDDSSDMFIRQRFNTNPQLASSRGTFFASDAYKQYWLGETFEQDLRDGTDALVGNGTSKIGVALHGVILPIALISDLTKSPAKMNNQPSREAETGWFVGQDLGVPEDFYPQNSQKLFKLKGRGHGEWLQKNAKVSIANVRASTSPSSDYGTFSVIIRALSDTDSNISVYERFDNLNLNPASPDFIGRRIGTKFTQWDDTSRRLKTYGDYPNNSKFVYVELNSKVQDGQANATYLPFGYFGPPRFTGLTNISGGIDASNIPDGALAGRYVYWAAGAFPATPSSAFSGGQLEAVLSCSYSDPGSRVGCGITGSLAWPRTRLRLSASDGGLSDPTNAYFGFQTTRTRTSTINDASVADVQRLWFAGQTDAASTGVDTYSYVFSLDDIVKDAGSGVYYYESGSRQSEKSVTSASYDDLLSAGYRNFTAPFWGGADGFDIKLPDPLYNGSMDSTSTNLNSSPYYTWRRAMDTVADPESVDMNLMVAPGLTVDNLTNHMIDVCSERADALALIDLANVYIPPHEQYKSSVVNRIGTTPTDASNALLNRRIDSSYGATFYPWVQTQDAATGILLWVPPSVAMAGVLASSQAATDVWFAPAGFNRGGLSDGAAGIPVTAVTERLTSKDRDTLYEARINPIASFPNTGIVVFGQKTLQADASALDRINVRRLVIYLKKQISILSTEVLFEQNVQATWNRFKSLIEPLLANVKVNFGITEYKLILDETTTTDDLIDQNILYAKIMVKPARAIEYIAIDFVISSTGASFDD
tara:strand:- start:5400 stop:8390 length:2991 start_codon:yes stop_codon:yes gene_type:complete